MLSLRYIYYFNNFHRYDVYFRDKRKKIQQIVFFSKIHSLLIKTSKLCKSNLGSSFSDHTYGCIVYHISNSIHNLTKMKAIMVYSTGFPRILASNLFHVTLRDF